jgi:bacillopeptidase F (M6 metalloprotease family)
MSDQTDAVDALDALDGWHAEEYAARVHYRGAGDRYSVEFYGPSECVLYWKVKGDGETAVPVGRDTVPDPLRARIREDLDAAGIDPAMEERAL